MLTRIVSSTGNHGDLAKRVKNKNLKVKKSIHFRCDLVFLKRPLLIRRFVVPTHSTAYTNHVVRDSRFMYFQHHGDVTFVWFFFYGIESVTVRRNATEQTLRIVSIYDAAVLGIYSCRRARKIYSLFERGDFNRKPNVIRRECRKTVRKCMHI